MQRSLLYFTKKSLNIFKFSTAYLPEASALIASIIILIYSLSIETSLLDENMSIVPGIGYLASQSNGIWLIIGFSLANLIWQFGDYTAYHRVSIIKLDGNEKEDIKRVRFSILATSISAPLTSFFGMIIGMVCGLLNVVEPGDPNVFNELTKWAFIGLESGNLYNYLIVISLSCLICAVLFSTIDSGLLAIGQMAIIDFLKTDNVWTRYLVFIASILFMGSFSVLHAYGQIDAFLLLGSVYSFTLIFGPPFIAKIFFPNASNVLLFLAILCGGVIGLISSFNPLNLDYLVSLAAPTISAISVSTFITIMSVIIAINRK